MDYSYQAFASYSTNVDRDLVRDVESFLESLHQHKLVAPQYRQAIELCVDGSDFRLPRRQPNHDTSAYQDSIQELVIAHMKQCSYFLLFVGPKSQKHPWINFELEWWLENRETETIIVVITHGYDPKKERNSTFPEAIMKHPTERNG